MITVVLSLTRDDLEFCFLSQVLRQKAPSILADVKEPGGIPRNNEGLSKHRNIIIS